MSHFKHHKTNGDVIREERAMFKRSLVDNGSARLQNEKCDSEMCVHVKEKTTRVATDK